MSDLLLKIGLIATIIVSFIGCHSRKNAADTDTASLAKTPVTVAHPSDSITISDDISLNATATYLLKSDVKANTTGYITAVNIKLADWVKRGQALFTLQTKEAHALGNTINELDPSLKFSGNTTVISPATGYVQMLNHQKGDFVMEGDALATISDKSSFGFLMDVPYEHNQYLINNKNLTVELPDGRKLSGYVSKVMPTVDPVAQTQEVLVQVTDGETIPENLIATVKFSKIKQTGLTVPKETVLTDETQSNFWVMKLINDTMAVKTPITKGIEDDMRILITSGNITSSDRLIDSGSYGLSDTAYVRIQNELK